MQVVLEEGVGRRVIFSTFDPDCATLLSLKQPRYPVLFLTCGGTKLFSDPRMNSLEAALQFALASRLQVRPPTPNHAARPHPTAATRMPLCCWRPGRIQTPALTQSRAPPPPSTPSTPPPPGSQGVVAEVSSVLGRLREWVAEFHRHGLFL